MLNEVISNDDFCQSGWFLLLQEKSRRDNGNCSFANGLISTPTGRYCCEGNDSGITKPTIDLICASPPPEKTEMAKHEIPDYRVKKLFPFQPQKCVHGQLLTHNAVIINLSPDFPHFRTTFRSNQTELISLTDEDFTWIPPVNWWEAADAAEKQRIDKRNVC